MAAINDTATYYFKSPDNSAPNFKVEILVLLQTHVNEMFGYYYDGQFEPAYKLLLTVNGQQQIIQTQEEDGVLPSTTVKISDSYKVVIYIDDETLFPSVHLLERREYIQLDRVVGNYWTEQDFECMSEEEYKQGVEEQKSLFAQDLKKMLDRYNKRRIYSSSITERILRLYRRHFGATPPKLSLKQIQELGGE